MARNGRSEKRGGGPPRVGAHQCGYVKRKQNARVKYGSRWSRNSHRHRLVRRVALRRDAALVRLRLAWLVVRSGSVRAAVMHRARVGALAARHASLGRRRRRRAEADGPARKHQAERGREHPPQKALHGSRMLRRRDGVKPVHPCHRWRPYRKYIVGTTTMFNSVDVINPNKITIAIGV